MASFNEARRLTEFRDDSGTASQADTATTSIPSTTVGRSELDSSTDPASPNVTQQQLQQRMANNVAKPCAGDHQKPSCGAWDSARTVDLYGSSRTTILSSRARLVWSAQRWCSVIVVGLLSCMSYVVIEKGVGILSSIRFGYCSGGFIRPEHECPESLWNSWGDGVGGFCASVGLGTVMAGVSAWIVNRFAPTASGSGIPEVKTRLNGFVLPDVFTAQTLVVKVPCLILAVASGMALGHEGPMVHVAVCWAHILIQFFPQFDDEGKRRELLSAGVAAGISSAFGTPVGGVLFSMEEVSSRFSPRTLLLSFVASACATLALSVINLTGNQNLTLYSVNYSVRIHPFEFVLFALVGIVGGLVGALFNTLNIRWNAFRMRRRVIAKQSQLAILLHPAVEVLLVSMFTLGTSFYLPFLRPLMQQSIHAMFDNCKPEPGLEEVTRSRLQYSFGICSQRGEDIEHSTKMLAALFVAAFLRLGQTAITIGTSVPAGLFVPCLFTGACLGRLIAGIVNYTFPESVSPGVYAMVGAAAVLGGVTRMTISLVVIMLELTGGLDYIIPFMVSVLFAKAVGDALTEGIYDLQIALKGYPFLHEELDITFTERCCDIMETQLTKVDVSTPPSSTGLSQMLQDTKFQGYPVMDHNHFIGYAWRRQLEDMIRNRTSEGKVTSEELRLCTDSTIMRMVPEAPLSHTHRVFQQLGCKHIFIVGSENSTNPDTLLGMISRKRFLSFLRGLPDSDRLDSAGCSEADRC